MRSLFLLVALVSVSSAGYAPASNKFPSSPAPTPAPAPTSANYNGGTSPSTAAKPPATAGYGNSAPASTGYGAAPSTAAKAPPATGYGAAPSTAAKAPPATGYGAAPSTAAKAPPATGYGAAPSTAAKAPPATGYGAAPSTAAKAPPATGYGAAPSTAKSPPATGYGPPTKPPAGPCDGKAKGYQFCQGDGIATCEGNGKISAKDCGLHVSKTGKSVIIKCTMNNGVAKCVDPAPCTYEDAGFKYCSSEGDGKINTCGKDKKVTAVDCPVPRARGQLYEGKCYTDDNGKAKCESIPQKGPCSGKRNGTYCFGESGLLTCPEGTAKDCPIARFGRKQYGGKCIKGDDERKCTCEPIPQASEGGYGRRARPNSYGY